MAPEHSTKELLLAVQEREAFLLAACRDAQDMASRYGWALHAIAQGVNDPAQAARDALLGAVLERTPGVPGTFHTEEKSDVR